MKRILFIFLLIILLLYVIFYKLYLFSLGGILQYILNPLIWVFISIVSTLFYESKKDYKYKYPVIYIVFISSLIYIISYYMLGLITGYVKNPYSVTSSNIIINIFSIIFLIGIKEYLRNIFILNEKYLNKRILFPLIFLIFFISDLNFSNVIIEGINFEVIFNIFGQVIIPIFSINLLSFFLCLRGGFVPAAIYRIITVIPLIFITIIPKLDWIIGTLFDILFPLFTYLIIKNKIEKKEEKIYKNSIGRINPKKWIIVFVLVILLVMFAVGSFPLKPLVIITPSMKPTINPGDVVIIEKCTVENIEVGNIVAYQVKDYMIVHRVVNIIEENSKTKLISKGDNNKNVDRYLIDNEILIGCVKYQIPIIGYPTYLIKRIFNNNFNVETIE